jgi:hypothetical protein
MNCKVGLPIISLAWSSFWRKIPESISTGITKKSHAHIAFPVLLKELSMNPSSALASLWIASETLKAFS